MTFKDTFCSSPWFHMRITPSGSYEYCRWKYNQGLSRINDTENIKNLSPTEYFHNHMTQIRMDLLQGKNPSQCQACHDMEQHGKVSGRQRQLLKSGILEKHFEKSLASSPMRSKFDYSAQNNGHTQAKIQDWQIDLGNYCNSACIFCSPDYSSRLATEHKQLGLIDQLPPVSWCDDAENLDRFVKDLVSNDQIRYLHFIGGETLITPAFKIILEALITAQLSSQITVGFTTNLTVWRDDVVALLKNFQQVNLGMSVETLTKVNDYVRWPSKIDAVKQNLNRWVELGRQQHWLMQIRITPTCLTVHELDTVYDYAWQNNISVESCNFLENPTFMRISVLPESFRQSAKKRLQDWVATHQATGNDQVINTRDPNLAKIQILQDAKSYINFLDNSLNETVFLPELIKHLRLLETSRGNCILTYIPEYEQLLRANGY